MSLRAKIVVLVTAVVLLYAGLDYFVQRQLVFESFVSLERSDAEKDLQRVVHAIQSEVDHLDRECASWAASDEAYRVASDIIGLEKPVPLASQAFDSSEINLLFVCNDDGKVLYSRIQDPDGKEMQLRNFPRSQLSVAHPLILDPDSPKPVDGVLMTERGAMLVSSRPVGTGTKRSRAAGTLIVGKLLDTSFAHTIATRTEVDFDLWSLDDPTLPEDACAVLDEISAATSPVVREVDDDRLRAYTTISDVLRAPALVARANIERDVTARGRSALRYALVSTIGAGLLLMLVLLELLHRTVVKPIDALTRHAAEISRSEDFSRRIHSVRNDEVGLLGREFDGMIEKVAQSRAQLVDAARAAGMSEIATAVLHNVGNVLNSVNVSATLTAERVRDSAGGDLRRVVEALRPSADDLAGFLARDPRGKHLFPLLDSLSNQLEEERMAVMREMQALGEGIDHIKELIHAQQGYAGRAGVLETVSLSELVDRAVAIAKSASAGGKVEFVHEYEDMPAFPIDRHRVTEILVNLIQNAVQSDQEAGADPSRIRIGIARQGDEFVRIEVTDNGVGIRTENLSRIFTHGFTTKKSGHGFGLHASANAATEIGGKLRAQSAGPGHGATFVLELPLSCPAAIGAAA